MAESGNQNGQRANGASGTDASTLKRALLAIEKLQARLDAVERAKTEPVAIIGMSCRFPGAPDVEAYWDLLSNGVDAISEVPPDRWDVDAYYDPDPAAPAKMTSRWGGFVKDVDQFDPQFFGISPREASRMDPQQRLLLECSWEALERAGLAVEKLAGSRTGVFVGISQVDYTMIQFDDRTRLDAYAATGGALSIAANRISYLYDFRGPSVAMDTACSSSLVAAHTAVESLRRRECDLALAGGVNLILSPELSITFSHAHMLAADGRCKTFDAAADGYVRGEGCGVLALKRLSDAQRDGDPIVAVILGSAVNQDGRSNGLTAPNGLAHQAAIREAFKNAKVDAEQVTYVEAHGTGTVLGDPIEMSALGAVMQGRTRKCLVGSGKTNIGHLEPASGAAALIKVALMLQHGQIAPHLHFKRINPYIPIDEMPLEIATEAQPWPAGAPRIAGVNSFGFGGTNAHLILAAPEPFETPVPARPEPERTHHVLALSAQNPAALKTLAARYATLLQTSEAATGDLCYTANAGRNGLRERVAVIAADARELSQKLAEVSAGASTPARSRRGKVAFLFTGEGSQYQDMARNLYDTHPTFRAALDECDRIVRDILPHSLLDVLYFGDQATRSLIHGTTYAQPALFAVEYALSRLWTSWGVQPDFLLGHGVGEYVAAVISGVFSLEDGLRLVAERARLVGSLPQDGNMATVLAEPQTVAAHLNRHRQVGIAAVNGPKRVVISGRRDAVAAATADLTAAGLNVRPMRVSHALQSPLMEPVLDEFESIADRVTAQAAQIPLLSGLTGRVLKSTPDARYWRRHLREAIQYNPALQDLASAGCRVFIEMGPAADLTERGKECLPEHEALWLSSLAATNDGGGTAAGISPDWPVLLESLGRYWAAGYDVDWSAFDKPYARRKVLAPTYPFQRERFWNESPLAALRRKGWLGGPLDATSPAAQATAAGEAEPEAGGLSDSEDASDQDAQQARGISRADIEDAPFDMRRSLVTDALRARIAKVLGLPVAGITEDQQLNHLGLDSIMAIELKSAVETALQVDVPITALLSGPTIAELADTLLGLLEGTTAAPGVPALVAEESPASDEPRDYPLSVGQSAMWLQHQVAPGSVYNPAYAARVVGEIDLPRLAAAFQRIVDRHPALRTTFHAMDGRLVQRVHPYMGVHFVAERADGLDDAALEARLGDLAYQPFDLRQGPPLRVYALQRGQECVLLLTAHHIVVDLWSLAILLSEAGALYADPDAQMPPIPVRYTDFVKWQEALLQSPAGEQMEGYWREKLSGELPVLELPTDRPRPTVQTFTGSVESLDLGESLTQQVRRFSEAAGVTPFVTLLAAFQALVQRYTGQEDVIVGSPTTGRSRAELANVVGYFVSPMAVRTSFAGDPSGRELVQRVQEAALGGLARADYPFPLLVEKLHPRRDPARTPIFQVMFVLERSHLLYEEGLSQFATGSAGTRMNLGGLPLESVAMRQRMSPFDMTLLVADSDKSLGAAIEYNLDLFDPATVQRMLGHYKTVLNALVTQGEQPLATLALLTPAEEEQILQEWSAGPVAETPLRHACIHQAFEAQVDATPGAIALHYDPGDGAPPVVWTYLELDQQANALGHRLQALGVRPDTRVALAFERSPEMIVAILGVLKAGGAYIPLDPEAPAERVARILDDAQPVACLADQASAHVFEAAGQRVEVVGAPVTGELTRPVSPVNADNLAYIIYTSGSTGAPKGVMLEHAGVVNLAQAQVIGFDVTPEDRVFQFASYTFDASVSEIFVALTSGAALHIGRRDVVLSPQNLTRALVRERITNITLPPTLLRLMAPAALPELRTIISAGDACTPDIVQRWAKGRRLLNAYGPTETTIGPTYNIVNDGRADFESPAGAAPVGRPIHNMRAYILDRQGRPVPAGVPGELYVGGIGLARGYVGRPDLTAEKFVSNRYATMTNGRSSRLYRTGDLAKWLPDGQIEFVGRVDYQVKIRGFRVELGEVEAVLGKTPGIKQAAVLVHRPGGARSNGSDDTVRLLAFFAPFAKPGPSQAEIRAHLRSQLPDYMMPAAFVCLDDLPLNRSGKIDRAALLRAAPADLVSSAGRATADAAPPQNQLQRDLATIWRQVLGVERVGIHDNFFDLGGHSLLMAQVHSRVQELLAREVPIVDLFRYPTIQLLAQHLSGEKDDQAAVASAAQQGQDRGQQRREALNAQRERALQRSQPVRNVPLGRGR